MSIAKFCRSYICKMFWGGIVGMIFPMIFVFLDLQQLGEEMALEQITFIIKSQDIYLFSVIAFPMVFAIIAGLFTRVIEGQNELREEQKKSAMNARLASLGVLSAGIGHEINNPLTVLQGNAFFIKKKLIKLGVMNEELEKRFEVTSNTISRIAKIVDGLRIMARTGNDKQEIVDVHKSIEQAVGVVAEIYKKEGVNLHFDFKGTKAFFNGNIGKFQQVVMNFVSNAKDAIIESGKKGNVTVSTFNDNAGKIVIQIADDGVGIAKENLEKIFETFFTTKEVGKGTGMGLSIVLSIVKDMKGEVNVDSKLGVGTTFTISFVAIDDPFMVEKGSNQKEGHREEKLKGRVLVVDDEEEIREILTDLLEDLGLEVEQACDGQEAYQLLSRRKDFDLVVTDLKMPKMTGSELIHKLKKEDGRDIKIIVITGGVDFQDRSSEKEAFQSLTYAYFTKPFSEDEIHQTIKKIFSSSN